MENNYEFLDELDASLMKELKKRDEGCWIDIFRAFMVSDMKNCVITFKNANERRNCLQSIRAWKQKYNIQITYGNYGPGLKIYIVKA